MFNNLPKFTQPSRGSKENPTCQAEFISSPLLVMPVASIYIKWTLLDTLSRP